MKNNANKSFFCNRIHRWMPRKQARKLLSYISLPPRTTKSSRTTAAVHVPLTIRFMLTPKKVPTGILGYISSRHQRYIGKYLARWESKPKWKRKKKLRFALPKLASFHVMWLSHSARPHENRPGKFSCLFWMICFWVSFGYNFYMRNLEIAFPTYFLLG